MSIYKKTSVRALLTASVSLGLAATSQPTFAQTKPADSNTATQDAAASQPQADIVVTANRRKEYAQKVGVSITAASGERLVQNNILSSEDLQRIVPGLNATAATGAGGSTFVIRGIGETDFSDHQEQPNANYQDGVYVPFGTAAGLPLFDMQRVEVLRGPQGTLFGRNATGGLIQYVSNKPTSDLGAAIEGALGSRDLKRVQGYINGGSDLIAGRLSFYYQDQNGNITNVDGPDRGNKRVFALRGQVQINPAPDTKITLRADGFNQDGTPIGYKAYAAYYVNGGNVPLPANVDAYGTGPGNDPYGYRNPYSGLTVAIDDPGTLTKRVRNVSMTIDQGLGAATLTSVTAYGHVKSLYNEDTDSSPINAFVSGLQSHARDIQQELRVTGSSDRFRYTVGLFFLDIDGTYSIFNDVGIPATLVSSLGLPAGRVDEQTDYALHTRSEAIYAQGEYDLTDRLTFILGGRYSWDQMHFNFVSNCQQTAIGDCAFFGGDGGSTLSFTGVGPVSLYNNYGDWSGKAQLNYKATPDVLFYASVSKGLKAAGYSAPLTNVAPTAGFSYSPEKLYAFELGEKAQFFDHKLTLNTSAYYYDYHDFQTFLFYVTSTQILNRNSRVYGGEMELTARPVRGITATASAAYTNFEIKQVFPGLYDQRPPMAPRFQANWGLTKTFDFGDELKLDVSYTGRHISSEEFNSVNTPQQEAAPYSVHDFAVRLESKRGWYAAAYLNNAFNKTYVVDAFDLGVLGYDIQSFGERRTASVAIGYRF